MVINVIKITYSMGLIPVISMTKSATKGTFILPLTPSQAQFSISIL